VNSTVGRLGGTLWLGELGVGHICGWVPGWMGTVALVTRGYFGQLSTSVMLVVG
jgi:hypothetical protein